MKTEILHIESTESEKILYAAELIRCGGLCVIPTETVYGLAANALDENAVEGIFRAKGRPGGNPLTVHIADFEDIEKYSSSVSEKALELARAFMPGPVTILVKKADKIPDRVTAGSELVGLRMPDSDVSREIIRRAGVPVVATSANLSGSMSPTELAHVLHDLDGRVDAVVDVGSSALGIESTVIDVSLDVPKILRLGTVGLSEIEKVIGRVDYDGASSPSGSLRHYSLGKCAVLVTADTDEFVKYTEHIKKNGKVAALCFDGEEEMLPCACVSYGREDEPESLARNLFAALRRLSEADADTVLLHCPRGDGSVVSAVYDHLLKTACGDAVDLKKGEEFE